VDWYVLSLVRSITHLSSHSKYHYTKLTRGVVIVLIAAEILVAAINIVVDLYAGVD
jgi:hypothetical protein